MTRGPSSSRGRVAGAVRVTGATVALLAAGCIIPPVLPEGSSKIPPTIVGGVPDFRDGVVVASASDVVTFSVTAVDPVANGTLFAALYRRNLDGSFELRVGNQHLAQDPEIADAYTGSLQTSICSQVPRQHEYFAFVYVSDTGFQNAGNLPPGEPPDAQVLGRYDYKYWVVSCQ